MLWFGRSSSGHRHQVIQKWKINKGALLGAFARQVVHTQFGWDSVIPVLFHGPTYFYGEYKTIYIYYMQGRSYRGVWGVTPPWKRLFGKITVLPANRFRKQRKSNSFSKNLAKFTQITEKVNKLAYDMSGKFFVCPQKQRYVWKNFCMSGKKIATST